MELILSIFIFFLFHFSFIYPLFPMQPHEWIYTYTRYTVNIQKKKNYFDAKLQILDTENIKLVFCAVKDTIMQSALKEFNLA